MEASRFLAVDHIELEVPPGPIERLQWFYGELCELHEVKADDRPGVQLCYRSGPLELRFHMAEIPRIDPIDCRLTILVPSLIAVREILEEQRLSFDWISGILYTDRRLEVLDPTGHRIALKQMSPFGTF